MKTIIAMLAFVLFASPGFAQAENSRRLPLQRFISGRWGNTTLVTEVCIFLRKIHFSLR